MSDLVQTEKSGGGVQRATAGNPAYAEGLLGAVVHAVPAKRLSGQGLLLKGRWKALFKNLILGLPEGIITMDVIVPFVFQSEGQEKIERKRGEDGNWRSLFMNKTRSVMIISYGWIF